jgi:chromate transporter
MKELALAFLKLGFTAFGGPVAHIAMMENEFVRRRKWLTREEFLDLLGASSLIPGPSSSEMAIFIGQKRAGWRGLLIAGLCFILPAALIVEAIAWFYVRYQSLPAVGKILYGVKPVIIAIILQAIWSLGRSALKTKLLAVLGAAVVILAATGTNIVLLILGSGLFYASLSTWSRFRIPNAMLTLTSGVSLSSPQVVAPATLVNVVPVTLSRIFLFFLKIGSIQFGSGYVLLAFLRTDLVERYRWLSEGQLLDAIAVGQFTPGPVFTTATFIGYLLNGPLGAVLATVGIFLPAFLLVAVSGKYVRCLRKSKFTASFLDGVNVASLALMTEVSWHLGRSSLVNLPTVLIAIISLILLLRYKLNSAWLVLLGGLIGANCPF